MLLAEPFLGTQLSNYEDEDPICVVVTKVSRGGKLQYGLLIDI
jgi:hypothetical protein